MLSAKDRRLLIKTVFVVFVGIVCATSFVYVRSKETPAQPRKVAQQYVLWPDHIRVQGDMVFADGRQVGTHRYSNMRFRVKSLAEKNYWQKMMTPVVVFVQGNQQPILPATNGHQFDAQQYYYVRRICSEVRVDQIQVLKRQPPASLIAYCHYWRAAAHQYFSHLPSPLSQYADQLVIGYQGEQTGWQETVKRLGIIHLFCLSGMHVVLLTELLRRVLVSCRLTRETVDNLLAMFLPAYLILGGGSASLIRSIIMAECRLLPARLKLPAIDGWAWSLIIGCWIDPLVLTQLGGQLSYLLSLLLHMLEQGELVKSLLLNLTAVPLIVNKVFEFHLLSFIMSYLVSPLFSLLLFPGTIITVLLWPWWSLPAESFNNLLKLTHGLLFSCSRLPGMVCFGKPPVWAVWLLLGLSLLLLDQPANRRGQLRLAGVYFIVFCQLHFPLHGEVIFADVGQGDSIIIKTPLNRRVIMIDTGGRLGFHRPRWAQGQPGRMQAEKTTINYLKSVGVNRLDAVFLSHSDADHIGDLPAVLTKLRVKRLYVPAGMEKMDKLRRRIPANSTVTVLPARSGDYCEGMLQVVHPDYRGHGKNGDSLTLFGRFGDRNFLFTGDLDLDGEREVIRKYPQLRVDVLKLGHHGSRTASGKDFLLSVHPVVGIISAGRFNRYGHPHNVTVRRLQRLGIRTMSTQQYGMIRYRYFGRNGRWSTTLRGDELKWMLPPYSNS